MILTALEVIGFIAIRPTYLDKNAFFGQQICHMQQLAERPNLGSKSVCTFSGARLKSLARVRVWLTAHQAVRWRRALRWGGARTTS